MSIDLHDNRFYVFLYISLNYKNWQNFRKKAGANSLRATEQENAFISLPLRKPVSTAFVIVTCVVIQTVLPR